MQTVDSQLSKPKSLWEVRCGVEPDAPSLFRPFRGQNVHECSREMSIGTWRSSDTVRVHKSKESCEGQIVCKFYTSRCTARFLFYCSVVKFLVNFVQMQKVLTLMLSGRAPKIVWSGDRYDPRWSSAAVSEWVQCTLNIICWKVPYTLHTHKWSNLLRCWTWKMEPKFAYTG